MAKKDIRAAFKDLIEDAMIAANKSFTTPENAVNIVESYVEKAVTDIYQSFATEAVGEDDEQNFYRDDRNNLMCKTCGDEVFGGICLCTLLNQTRKEIRTRIKASGEPEKEDI